MTYIASLFAARVAPGPRRTLACCRLLACALLAVVAVHAGAACPLDAPNLGVTDIAGVLGDRASVIAGKLAGYQEATGHQVAVLLVPSLDGGMSVDECAVTKFKQWQLGKKGVDDGVLLLVAVKDRKMRIEVGYGLEGVLTDVKSSRIIREVIGPRFARGAYAEGIEGGVDAIMTVIGAPDSAPRYEPKPADRVDANNETIGKCVVTLIAVVVLLASTLAGIAGLLAFGTPIIGLVFFSYQDWRGYLFGVAYVLIWSLLRVRLIRANVVKYHLKKSRNKALSWIRCFLAVGWAEQESNKKARASKKSGAFWGYGFSYSTGSSGGVGAGDSSSSSDSSSGSSSSSSDSGGASGGGGASGEW